MIDVQGSKRITVGSVFCDERASVYELSRGFVVECTCGGTIGVTFPMPFDLEGSAIDAANVHVCCHVEDALADARATLALAQVAAVIE